MAMTDYKQIVLMKGWEGFADRLQVLSHCLEYCKKNNAAICVDWRDIMWGQNDYNFSDYFEIIGIPTVSLETIIDKVKYGATILPAAFNIESITNPPNESIHLSTHSTPIMNGYKRVNADIIIDNCKGVRSWHIENLTTNLRLNENVANIIKSRFKNLEGPFTAIHLRGTDRLANKNIKLAIKPAIDELMIKPPHVMARLYVISDMKEMINAFKSEFPEAITINNDNQVFKIISDSQGTHQLPKEVLDFYGANKYLMNIDTLTDFFLMGFANWIVSNSKESLFSSMAIFMRQAGKVQLGHMLHGFNLQTKTLPKTGTIYPSITMSF